jgi:putative hemolysin
MSDSNVNEFEQRSASFFRVVKRQQSLEQKPALVELANVSKDNSAGVAQELSYKASWAVHLDEVRAAQRLRYDVFVTEFGAQIRAENTHSPHQVQEKLDRDEFDDYCEHLIVKESSSGQVVGTYRVLPPLQAKRIGRLYSENEFDLSPLKPYRKKMVELGRSCVHPDHRSGGVIMALGSALFQFMHINKFESMVGCASIPMQTTGHKNGHAASAIWHQLKKTYLADSQHLVKAYCPLPLEEDVTDIKIEAPPLIKGYLRMGAKILGAPAWDKEFNTADLPIMAQLANLPERYRKHFLA